MLIAIFAFTVALPSQAIEKPATVDPVVCAVDVEAQMVRPWQDYEFSHQTPGGPMWLAGRGCFLRAADVSRAYLARGPLLSVREQAIAQLHLARYLAYGGDEVAAAQAAASARRSDQRTGQEIPLDWNSYVQGLYAFLVKDRPLLDANLERLRASPHQGDALNGRNLAALSSCFNRSYYEAMTDATCWAPETPAP